MNTCIQIFINLFSGIGRVFGFAIAGLAICLPASAQTAASDDSSFLEEIVVTASTRGRATNVQDVPVAISVMTGDQIEAAGITDMFDLQQNVPGLIVGQSQTATTSNFAIRGVGSTSNNFGVESSVGLYVDGVYRSRQGSMINDLIDVSAVEVLRGPQGTLFGKNTASGAILVSTVRPSQDRNAFVEATAGDFGLLSFSAASNIPINDDWAFRGTIFSSQRDGYVDDDSFGKDSLNDRDRIGGRLQLAKGDPSDDFNMLFIADYAEIDETCCVGISRVDGIYSRASLTGAPQAGSDVALVALGGTVYTDYPYPQPFLDALAGFPGTIVTGVGFHDYRTSLNTLPVSQNDDSGLSAELNWNLDNGMSLKSISAYRAFNTLDQIDADFTNVDILTRINKAEQSSFSQEFILAGDIGDNGSNFVSGVYYFGQEIKSWTDTNGGVLLGPYIGIVEPDLGAIVNGVNAVSAATMGALPPAANPFPTGTFSSDSVDQDHSGWAAFGQVDIALGEKAILTLGGRYTDEKKDIKSTFVQTAQGPPPDLTAVGTALFLASQGMPFNPAALAPVSAPNEAWGSYLFAPLAPRPDLDESVSDDQFTGTAKFSYFPNESIMMYASYATGYKAGGTNTDRISPLFDPVFGPETSESIELGFKGDFGNVRLNLAIYETNYDDFQANSFTGTGFNLQNAGKLETNGIEAEFLWQATSSTEIQGYYAHNNGDYKTFVGGTCWDTYVFHTQTADPGSGGDVDAEVCDRSGNPLPYNPEDRAFLALTQDFHLSGSTTLFLRAEYTYASDLFTDGDDDPFAELDSVSLVNLRIGLHLDDWKSDLTFWGRNITDERYYSGSYDVPLTAGRMNSYPSEPATYGVTFRKSFD